MAAGQNQTTNTDDLYFNLFARAVMKATRRNIEAIKTGMAKEEELKNQMQGQAGKEERR